MFSKSGYCLSSLQEGVVGARDQRDGLIDKSRLPSATTHMRLMLSATSALDFWSRRRPLVIVSVSRAETTQGEHGPMKVVILAGALRAWLSEQTAVLKPMVEHVPRGAGHCYQALEDGSAMTYLIRAAHVGSSTRSQVWRYESVGIDWSLQVTSISQKDRGAPSWPAAF